MKIKELFSKYKKISIAVILALVVAVAGVFIAIFSNSDSKNKTLNSNVTDNSTNNEEVAKNDLPKTEESDKSNTTKTPENDEQKDDTKNTDNDDKEKATDPNKSENPDNKSENPDNKSENPVQNPEKPTKTEGNKDEVVFSFYSSSAQNVYLAGEMNNWSTTATKMTKNGNWFTVSVPLEKNTQYKFVVDGCWMIDPFSIDTKSLDENSYIDLKVNGKTNKDKEVYVFSSQHFDYFSLTNKAKTSELESLYATLNNKLLKFINAKPARGKIRYYAIDYTNDNSNSWFNTTVPFARCDTSEVFDLWDCNSSHELIHTLVHVNNQFFNEGIAQCFQYEGNMSHKDQNVNINMSNKVKQYGTSNFMSLLESSITRAPQDYYVPASFIYYNVEVLNNDAQFASFLKSLSYSDSLFDIQKKYQTATNKSMSSVVAEWENWLKSIDASSNVYIKW